jgi:hypothetical protein
VERKGRKVQELITRAARKGKEKSVAAKHVGRIRWRDRLKRREKFYFIHWEKNS